MRHILTSLSITAGMLAGAATISAPNTTAARAQHASPNFVQAAPRLTSADFIFNVGKPDLWLSPHMRRVAANPPTFVVGRNPQLQYKGWIYACQGDFSYFFVRMSASPAMHPRIMRIYYWLNDGQRAMLPRRSVEMSLHPDGGMYSYAFPIARLHLRRGARILGMRLDPVSGLTSTGARRLVIAQFRLVSAMNRRSTCG
ncbi:MAG: hypothetical protein ACR2JC_20575 [Chloroflexota bacterium]